jgi:CheY-like chemotaxis protein
MKVLVVDDSITAQNILSEMLESFGFEVSVAGSGEQALSELDRAAKESRPYKLVLMDWKMPRMNGIETFRRIRQNTHLPQMPMIIMVTAFGREEIMQQAEQLGLDGFLIKPVNASTLFNTIMDIFGKKVDNRPIRKKPDAPYWQALGKIKGAKILLVEDNEINQQVACEILDNAGFNVTLANNGLKAIQNLHNDWPTQSKGWQQTWAWMTLRPLPGNLNSLLRTIKSMTYKSC